MVRTEGPSSEGDQVAEWWKTFRIERQQGGYIVRQYAAGRWGQVGPRHANRDQALAYIDSAIAGLLADGAGS